MTKRRLLVDNDAFILLSGAGFLQQAIESLGCSFENARRLQSLEFMLRKPARCLLKYSADVRNRALEQCGRMPSLEIRPASTLLEQFVTVQEVDDGEAVLYGLVAEQPHCMLASNDKRAMLAVATDRRLASVREAVSGRIICMETVVKVLIGMESPSIVAERFGGLNCSDKRLATVLSLAGSGRPQDCFVGARFKSGCTAPRVRCRLPF
jgi:hypothetical protein